MHLSPLSHFSSALSLLPLSPTSSLFLPFRSSYQVREAWQTYELELINYQNKCKIIRGWDDLFTKVKEHINSVTAMKLSPYFKVSGDCVLCCVLVRCVAGGEKLGVGCECCVCIG